MCPVPLKKAKHVYKLYISFNIVLCFILKPFFKLFKKTAWTIASCAASGKFSDRCGVWREDVPVEHVEWMLESLQGIGICMNMSWRSKMCVNPSALQQVKGICCVRNWIGWIYLYRSNCTQIIPGTTRPVMGFGSIKALLRSSVITTRESRKIHDVWYSTPNGTINDLDHNGKSIQFNNVQ